MAVFPIPPLPPPMIPVILLLSFLTMIVQFSGVVVPSITLLLNFGMSLYQITALWLAAHTVAVAIAYSSTNVVSKRSERIANYLEGKRKEAEKYIGSHGLFVGLIIFNFSIWIYIAVPIMVLMRIGWKKIFLAATIADIFYYMLMVSTSSWLYNFTTNIILIVAVTLVIAFAVSIIAYQAFKRIT
nr:hypothetical protein [Candidatus Freyarchaeota archaeon]